MCVSSIKFLDKKSLLLMGKWMSQKWTQIIKKEKFAIEVLTALNMDYGIFRSEWKKQVKDQTKSLLRCSEDLTNKAIQKIMALIISFDSYKAELEKLNDGLLAGNLNGFHDITEMVEARNTILGKISQIEMGIKKKKANLEIDVRFSDSIGESGRSGHTADIPSHCHQDTQTSIFYY
ncbi:hypothetical protein BDQ12DRAFT_670802 [Crucibulum laeve]|uniref:Uncharacterized protein n=1 Tax=Crucibulum laeve TaxID=68775 RepID=A0A5C3LJM6_9AGAR|nr:hypothetical protein BDQ12DRAFT_670802 [Crucibulum laeve]